MQAIKLNENYTNAYSNLGLSYMNGLRNPSLYEMFGTDNYGYSGNINLKPEKSNTYEIYSNIIINENLSFSSRAFKANIKNNIEYISNKYQNDTDNIDLNEKNCGFELSCNSMENPDGQITIPIYQVITGGNFSEEAIEYGESSDNIFVPDNSDLSEYMFELYNGGNYINNSPVWSETVGSNLSFDIGNGNSGNQLLGAGIYTLVLWGPDGQTNENYCPVANLKNWLQISKIKSGPIFRRFSKGSTLTENRLTDQSVVLLIKEYLKLAGIENKNFAGHSLRSGFATVAAESGADERSIMAMTGHKTTQMVRRYIKEANIFKNNALNKIKI